MKRILITGGAGLIGSHLCKALVEQGHSVVCVDNFSTGKMDHILPLLDQPNFLLIEQDVTTPLIIEGEIDEIYHLACPASPAFYQLEPVATMKTNVIGTMNALDLARAKNARLLFSSTSEVYGDPLEHPQSEHYNGNVNPIGIRACYDEGKRAAEALCFDYNRQYGTKFKVVRIFNTYGPHLDAGDGRAISNFIVQALAHQPITMYGDGLQTRCFCYVEDMIKGLMGMMATPEEICGPVNLGTTAETTMLELVDKVIALTDSPSKINFYPKPQDDPVKRKPDLHLAQEILGWAPSVTLEEGIRRTIPHFSAPLISIIIPIYNCEAYLKECVDSILAQTLTSWELLLVDDGSTDGGGSLCDDYAAKDPRIMVIHQQNGGISSARSAGFGRSKGQYIGFVDSDDILEPELYRVLLDLLQEHDAGVSCCDYYEFNDGEDSSLPAGCNADAEQYILTGKAATEKLYVRQKLKKTNIFLWNKLFKRSVLIETGYWNKRFDLPHFYLNDTFLTPQTLFNSERVAYTTKKLYRYRQRNGSLKRETALYYLGERPKVFAFLSELFGSQGQPKLRGTLLEKQAVEYMRIWMEANARLLDPKEKEAAKEAIAEYRLIYPEMHKHVSRKIKKLAFLIFRWMPRLWFLVFRRYYFSHFSGHGFSGAQAKGKGGL